MKSFLNIMFVIGLLATTSLANAAANDPKKRSDAQTAALIARGIDATLADSIGKSSHEQYSITNFNLQANKNNGAAIIVTQPILSTGNLAFCNVQPAPGVNYSGCSFVGVNFSGQDLRGANFAGTNLNNANFAGANLAGANFSWAFIAGVNFSQSNLTSVTFSNAWSTYSNYLGATVTGFHLPQALELTGSTWIDGSACRPSNAKCSFVGKLP